jgi:hypothetical protein
MQLVAPLLSYSVLKRDRSLFGILQLTYRGGKRCSSSEWACGWLFCQQITVGCSSIVVAISRIDDGIWGAIPRVTDLQYALSYREYRP